MKRILAWTLSMVFLLTALPLGAVSVAAEEDYSYLELGVVTEAVRDENYYAYFYFTPAESGYHIFKSVHDEQDGAFANGYIFTQDGFCLEAEYDQDEYGNFRIAYSLTAGETYLLQVGIYNTKSFPICIVKEEPRIITNVEFLDDTILMSDANGDLIPRMWVTYSDGTAEEVMATELEDDSETYYLDLYFVTPPMDFEVGGTYTLIGEFYIPGWVSGLWESEFNVTVAQTPVEAVEIAPIILPEYGYGYYWTHEWMWDEETGEKIVVDEYFRYWTDIRDGEAVITLKDGTVIEGTEFMWNDRTYTFSTEEQSYENQLQFGVNEWNFSIAGYEGTYTIEITDTPVVSVDIGPYTVIEEQDGYWDTDWEWDAETGEYIYHEYFEYYVFPRAYSSDDFYITLKDGTVINDMEFEWNGRWYYLEGEYQSYDNQLQLGVNELTYSIAGHEGIYIVNVVDTLVASVEITGTVTRIENSNGYWTTDRIWDEEIGEYVQSPEYFYYDSLRPDWGDITITLIDGTVIENDYFKYQGDWYYFEPTRQSYDNRLQLGVNEWGFSIAGYEGTYTVEIVETPVASVEIKPLLVAENINGYWISDEVWDEETGEYIDTEYFYYENIDPDRDECVITLKDGTVINGIYVMCGGRQYNIHCESQSYENRLQYGINERTFSIAGYEGIYTVEVVDTPVASHWTAPIQIQENQFGKWVDVWDEEEDDYTGEQYFYYNYLDSVIENKLLLTMKDGTKQFAEYCRYDVEVEQTYENRLLPGLNEVTFSIAGYTGTCTVEVIPSPVASVSVEPIVYTQYADATVDYDWEWDEETQQDIRIPYFCYDVAPDFVTITFKDGTTATYEMQTDWSMDYPYITHNGERYAIIIDDAALYNRDWEVGVHTISASVMGCDFTYTVEIVERDTDSIYEYIPAEGGIIITDCYFPEETMEIPATIDGKTVIGVAGLPYEVKHLILPDTVATIDDWLLSGLVSVSFGAGVRNLHAGMFEHCYDLQSVTIAPANPYFTVIDGAVYDKAGTTFIGYPMQGEDLTHTVPRTAVDLGALNFMIYDNLSVTLEEGNPNAVTIDGVTYDKGMTRVLFCDPDKEGVYVMPSTVTDIAEAAFRGCSKLTEVTISPSVTSIIYFSFSGCTGLQTVHLPQGLVSIEAGAFNHTPALESVTLPDTLTSIGWDAFKGSGLTSLTLPNSVKSVGDEAFCGSDIATLDLGNGVEGVGWDAFNSAPLRSVVLPDSLMYLGGGAFQNCRNLKSVSIGQGLTAINNDTFHNTGLESITIPANIQSIGYYAFACCDSLRQVNLTNGLESIGEEAFYHNSALEEIVIPDSVTYLGWRAFKWCESLTRAVIGAGVTYIDEDTFAHCPLEELDFRGRLQTIGTWAFAYGNMTSIAIPDSVTSIMYCAFRDCARLEEIHMPPSVMDLGYYAFDGTAWYDAQPDGITYLSHIAYDWKGEMAPDTAITIPEHITLIADGAFGRQPNLTAATLPENLRVIGEGSFYEDYNLSTLLVGKSLEQVQKLAFYRCYGLTDVYYSGSEADRAAITIDTGNDPLLGATWHYNTCGAEDHVYDNYCDNTCNRCDWVRPDALGHAYRNGCDPDCNNCGLTRTPPHQYGDVCDAACNGCGLTREPPHQYADTYDADCDLCGAVREVTAAVFGDANGDGKVNVRDLGRIQQYLNGWDVELDPIACDVNGDGKVNVRDLGRLQQYLNGWDVELGTP